MKSLSIKNSKGFTLIELLVVIGILAVLLAIVLIAINPARQFARANDTKRKSDVNAILNAVGQYAAENNGQLPAGITTSPQIVSNTAANLCSALVPTYISALPTDPQLNSSDVTNCGATYNTGYTIVQSSSSSRITVAAPNTEIGPIISISR